MIVPVSINHISEAVPNTSIEMLNELFTNLNLEKTEHAPPRFTLSQTQKNFIKNNFEYNAAEFNTMFCKMMKSKWKNRKSPR